MTAIREKLRALEACDASLRWISAQETTATPMELWLRCDRPDWLLWLVGRDAEENKLITGKAQRLIVCIVEMLKTTLVTLTNPTLDLLAKPVVTLEIIVAGSPAESLTRTIGECMTAIQRHRTSVGGLYYYEEAALQAFEAAFDLVEQLDSLHYLCTDIASELTDYLARSSFDGSVEQSRAALCGIIRKHFPEPPVAA